MEAPVPAFLVTDHPRTHRTCFGVELTPMPNQHVEVGPFVFGIKDVLLPMGLRVASVDVRGEGGTLDSEPFALRLSVPGSMEARVEEEALAEFLEQQAPGGIHGFSVRAEGGKIHVRAKKTMLVELKITALASLRLVEGRQLWIDVESVDVMGAGAKNLVQSQIDKINPVLDVSDLPVDATLSSVEIGDGRVILRGTVSPR